MTTFALIGAAGYIAPRHMKAIKDVGGELVAALDPHDSVGVLDSYFPRCAFFTEFERFDRHCEKLSREGKPIDYVSICSPNYLHDAHAMFALRIGADAICEKPLVLREYNLDALRVLENETGKRVWTVYQLRVHPEVLKMKEAVCKGHHVEIDYKTPRGKWYDYSWKSNLAKSGGLPSNIGCHLFDACCFMFGAWETFTIRKMNRSASGTLLFPCADVTWNLSIEWGEPKRVFKIDGKDFNINDGFKELHTKVYEEILKGNGIGLQDVRQSVALCDTMRQAENYNATSFSREHEGHPYA